MAGSGNCRSSVECCPEPHCCGSKRRAVLDFDNAFFDITLPSATIARPRRQSTSQQITARKHEISVPGRWRCCGWFNWTCQRSDNRGPYRNPPTAAGTATSMCRGLSLPQLNSAGTDIDAAQLYAYRNTTVQRRSLDLPASIAVALCSRSI